uniref:Reverse transcriptase zinc-binding domain-containing protein n=1 Tax=Aegilops tauschii subsp. strangulata TaxID=200361 RepID=A0A453PZ75_AEGTS
MGMPCTDSDKDLFAAATRVCIGDGKTAKFWESSWLDDLRPRDITPKIFEISKRKACVVSKALDNHSWIHQINTQEGLTLTHIQQFAKLWEMLAGVTLRNDMQDTISWKFTTNGEYSASTAYLAQFADLTYNTNNATIWKMWAPPKCKFFAWLVLQNRVWTADRLTRRGWPNCGLCPLCKQVQESAAHLLFQCRFSGRVWNEITVWLGIHHYTPLTWRNEDSVRARWIKAVGAGDQHRKALASVMMLVSWEIWKERNARIFRNMAAPTTIVVSRIKEEARLWALAGAKHLSLLMSRE